MIVGVAVSTALLASLGVLVAGLLGAPVSRIPGFPDARVGIDGTPAVPPPDHPTTPAVSRTGHTTGVPSTGPDPASPSADSRRRVPTHTPGHPRPSKSR